MTICTFVTEVEILRLGLAEMSRLSQLVPGIGRFFTHLPLKESFLEINKTRCIIGRTFIPPSFNDIRHILNRAQVKSIAKSLELITLSVELT